MASLNKVMLIGNLGADPDVRYTSDGSMPIATLSIATTRNYRNQQTNEQVSETEWHRVVFFGKQAETIQKYMRKGSSIYVEGRLRYRKYEKDGVTRYTTEIVGESFQFVGSRSSDMGEGAPAPRQASSYSRGPADSFEKPPVSQQRPAPYQQPSQPATAPAQRQPAAPMANDPFDDDDVPF